MCFLVLLYVLVDVNRCAFSVTCICLLVSLYVLVSANISLFDLLYVLFSVVVCAC